MNKKKDFFDRLENYFSQAEFLKKFFPPINKAGYPFILIFFIIFLLLSSFSDFLGWVGFILTVWCISFFRDPQRVIPKQKNIIVSPADGKILKISKSNAPETLLPEESPEFTKVSIFMNVFDVHINRIPIDGKIVWLKYIPGTFFNASLDKSSTDNERMISKIEIDKKFNIFMVQIAGLIARRIVCEVKQDQDLKQGERIGMIRFGSRVDLFFKNKKILAKIGQNVVAGESLIASE